MNGEKLRLVRLAMKWQQVDLAKHLDVPQPHLSAMESGLRNVPDSIKERVSFLTGFAPSFFDLPIRADVPVGNGIWYRKQRDKYRKTEESQAYCQLVFDTFEPLTSALKERPIKLARLRDATPTEAAGHIRTAFGIRPDVPIENITHLAESIGVRVVGIPNPIIKPHSNVDVPSITKEDYVDDFNAFSFWTSNDLPVIFIRSDIPADLYQWALAHELIHLVMHSTYHGDVRQAEKESQQGTSELLMPANRILEVVGSSNVRTAYLGIVAETWNVSLKSMVLRVAELSLINDPQKRYHLAACQRGVGSNIVVKRQLPRFYRQMCELLFGNPISFPALRDRTGAQRQFIEDVLLAHSGNPLQSERK